MSGVSQQQLGNQGLEASHTGKDTRWTKASYAEQDTQRKLASQRALDNQGIRASQEC